MSDIILNTYYLLLDNFVRQCSGMDYPLKKSKNLLNKTEQS